MRVSRNEAYTAAALQVPTHELADPTRLGESPWGLRTTDGNRIVVFGGGSLEADGDVAGTIGVSGGGGEADVAVASAGVERFEELTG